MVEKSCFCVFIISALLTPSLACDADILQKLDDTYSIRKYYVENGAFLKFLQGKFVEVYKAENPDYEQTIGSYMSATYRNNWFPSPIVTHVQLVSEYGTSETRRVQSTYKASQGWFSGIYMINKNEEKLPEEQRQNDYKMIPLFLDKVTGVIAYYKCAVKSDYWFTAVAVHLSKMMDDGQGSMEIKDLSVWDSVQKAIRTLGKVPEISVKGYEYYPYFI